MLINNPKDTGGVLESTETLQTGPVTAKKKSESQKPNSNDQNADIRQAPTLSHD